MRRPRPLWQDWKRVSRRLAAAPRLALFSDFDGTLAPLVSHPDRARLPARTRAALERLRSLPGVTVGIASGRSRDDLQRRVGLKGVCYLGTHGLERAGRNGTMNRSVSKSFRRHLRAARGWLQKQLGSLRGIYLEPKSLSVAVHFRHASPRTAQVARGMVKQLLNGSRNWFRLLEGKKVLELLPPGREDKGRAVLEAAAGGAGRAGGSRPMLIYLGDDVTDESVFQRLRRGDVGIRVGRKGVTAARYRLHSPQEVARFLSRLGDLRAGEGAK
ncbi:MAG: trehalose-phosphatase [Candidatus Acidiferrales bacterium]